MKYLKLKETYGESIVIGYLIIAVLLVFVDFMFIGEKNITGAIFSLVCAVLSILGILDNISIINLITKTNELNADTAWWKGKYEKECRTCTELRTKQIKLEHELDVTKCQLESSKKATQDANQQIRHLEAEVGRLKDSRPKSDQDIIDAFLKEKKSNRNGYSLFLHKCGPSKLRVVKVIMHYITHDLRKAKALADKAPCTIVENIREDEANLIHNELTNEGAAVSVEC